MGRGEVHTGFWFENLGEGDNFEDLDLDGRIILEWIFKKYDGAWSGLALFKTETHGETL